MKRQSAWTEPQINATKVRVRQSIEAVLTSAGPDAAMSVTLGRISALAEAEAPEQGLERFVLIITALVLAERHGGLNDKQIDQLVDMAHALLQTHGVKAETSRQSFLYGEIHTILSQLWRRRGDNWAAAWEQQLVGRLARRAPPGGKGFQSLTLGARALRLGDAALALGSFESAAAADLPTASKEQLSALHIQALRLSGNVAAAKALIAQTLGTELKVATRLDVEWQDLCLDVAASGSLDALMTSTKKNHPHSSPAYILEAYLWTMATLSTRWFDRQPAFETLSRRQEVALGDHVTGTLARCVRALARCYDDAVPFTLRLKQFSEVLATIPTLMSVDKELLAWMAATRWLVRNNYFEMAALTYGQYGALSMRLSSHKSADVLGLASDLADRSWLKDLKGGESSLPPTA